jgi:hypothetical protein
MSNLEKERNYNYQNYSTFSKIRTKKLCNIHTVKHTRKKQKAKKQILEYTLLIKIAN